MKILFLHLSDAHFKENTKIRNINIQAMVNGLKQIDRFDECVLVFSGDIAQSGERNQYKVAEYFIGTLVKQIKESYLPNKRILTLIVPGNHDNLAANPKRTIEELKGYYSLGGNINTVFYNELSQLDNFYAFARRNLCYTKGKVVDVRKITFEKFTIKVNLINSAPFSLLCDGNEDKGLHYIPQKELDKLDFVCQENYTLSIIHHGPEWFSDDSKQALYNKLYETSDLIFVGHEHFSLSQNKTVNAKHTVDISSSVALYETRTEHGFNTLILDTEQHTLTGHKFVYNGSIYKPIQNLMNKNVTFRGKYKFTHTQEFKDYLESDVDERVGDKYLDYFVFPSLEAKSINDDMKNYSVPTEEKFMELFALKKKISIEGSTKSGKTILAKYLCRMLADNYVPIFLEEGYFLPKDNHKIIQYALENQYGGNADFDEFMQLDTEKKILIIDGYDKISKGKWKSFIEEFEDKFGHFILFGRIDWNLNIKEKALEELAENNIFYMRISPFYYAKR